MSILQGGNGFPFLSKTIYKYIVSGVITDVPVEIDCIGDGTLKVCVQKV